jgi:toxin ParE1/3/4
MEVAAQDVRRALMRRFPYVIHFRIVREDTVRITVVKHTKRHPGYGRGRA